MSTRAPAVAAQDTQANRAGALLLCRADPQQVAPAAHLLRERMLLVPCGEGWSALVPEGKPWRQESQEVDQVVHGWASALAVGSDWPVLGLWWDADHSGFTLASGFLRTVGYVWLANGTPVGEDEAMRTFAARLGLHDDRPGQVPERLRPDPGAVDRENLEAAPYAEGRKAGDDALAAAPPSRQLAELTRPDAAADARHRLGSLLGVLRGAGLDLPAGLRPGEPADRLREVARVQRGVEHIEWDGWRDTVRAELDAVEEGPLGPWLRGPRAQALGAAQLAAGLPLALTGLRRRNAGWTVAGLVLLAYGGLQLAYDRLRCADGRGCAAAKGADAATGGPRGG